MAVVNPALELWDVADRTHPRQLAYTHGDLVMPGESAFSPDGRVLATNGGGRGVLWNVADPARLTEIAVLPGRDTGQGAMMFSPDGRILATADNGTVVLWDVRRPGPRHAHRHLDRAGRRHFRRVVLPGRAAAGQRQRQRHGDLAERRRPGRAGHHRHAALHRPAVAIPGPGTGADVALAFSASGRTLTTIAGNTTVTLWNVTDPAAVSRIATITGDSIGAGEWGDAAVVVTAADMSLNTQRCL